MGFVAAICPSCGANIQLPEGSNRCFCTYCGNQVLFQEAVAKKMEIEGTVATRAADFDIQAGCLLGYHGESTDVVVPQNVRTFGGNCFRNQRITSITLPKQLDWMSYDQMRGIPTLRALNYEYEGMGWHSYDGVLYSLKDRELIVYPSAYPKKSYTIVEGTKKVTIIGNPYLEELIFEPCGPNADITIRNCANLKTITFEPSADAFPVIDICECKSLQTVNLPSTGITSLTLEKCGAVKQLDCPNFVEKLRLSYCSALTTVDCPSALDTLFLGSCPISHFNADDCVSLTSGAGDVHIEHIDAKNLVIGTKIDRLATWGAWETVTFAKGIEQLDHLRFNSKTHIVLPSTLKYIGEDITTWSGTTYEFPNYDKVDIRCLQLKNWRSEQWSKSGRCPKCGGTFSGLFTKKCSACGYVKPKN